MGRIPFALLAVLAAMLVLSSPSGARRVDGAGELTFYSQAGILWA